MPTVTQLYSEVHRRKQPPLPLQKPSGKCSSFTHLTDPLFGSIHPYPCSFGDVSSANFQRRGADVAITYRLPVDMPQESYMRMSLMDLPFSYWTDFRPPAWKGRKHGIASMVSACKIWPERTSVIKALEEHIEVRDVVGAVTVTYLEPWMTFTM